MPTGPIRSRVTGPVSQAAPGRMTPPRSQVSQPPPAAQPLADLPRDSFPADAAPDYQDGLSSRQVKGETPDPTPVVAQSAARGVSGEPEGAFPGGTAQQSSEGRAVARGDDVPPSAPTNPSPAPSAPTIPPTALQPVKEPDTPRPTTSLVPTPASTPALAIRKEAVEVPTSAAPTPSSKAQSVTHPREQAVAEA